MAVFAHYDCLQWTRWASDITRAARDNVNWALEHRTCADRGISMVFGTSSYHPMRDRKSLAILGIFGKEEDYERRQKLTGTTVQKAKDGGAPRSERQMAHGFRHQRVPGTQRRVKDATRGGTLDLPLTGTITNIRTKSGKATAVADTIAYPVFGQGRGLEEIAEVHDRPACRSRIRACRLDTVATSTRCCPRCSTSPSATSSSLC